MTLHPTAQKVQDLMQNVGCDCQVLEFPQGTRTSQDAADALGCSLAQIAKSIIFRAQQTDRCVVVITSGANRADESKVAALVGEPVQKGDADFVRVKTGYVIGGVPPLGYEAVVFIDEDLMQFAKIYGAAGTPSAVFEMTPEQMLSMSQGRVENVKQG